MRAQKSTNQKYTLYISQLAINIDSESGHHYLKNPAYGWVFAFLCQINSPVTTLWSHPRKPVPAVFHGA